MLAKLVKIATAMLLDKYRDFGLLLLRLGIGGIFVFFHGSRKILAGPELWMKVGKSMELLGISFMPTFWGFMASISEFGGGLLLILGLFSRIACFLMLCVMTVASNWHLANGDGFGVASHPISLGIVFISLFLIGPGRHSLDQVLSAWASRKQADQDHGP